MDLRKKKLQEILHKAEKLNKKMAQTSLDWSTDPKKCETLDYSTMEFKAFEKDSDNDSISSLDSSVDAAIDILNFANCEKEKDGILTEKDSADEFKDIPIIMDNTQVQTLMIDEDVNDSYKLYFVSLNITKCNFNNYEMTSIYNNLILNDFGVYLIVRFIGLKEMFKSQIKLYKNELEFQFTKVFSQMYNMQNLSNYLNNYSVVEVWLKSINAQEMNDKLIGLVKIPVDNIFKIVKNLDYLDNSEFGKVHEMMSGYLNITNPFNFKVIGDLHIDIALHKKNPTTVKINDEIIPSELDLNCLVKLSNINSIKIKIFNLCSKSNTSSAFEKYSVFANWYENDLQKTLCFESSSRKINGCVLFDVIKISNFIFDKLEIDSICGHKIHFCIYIGDVDSKKQIGYCSLNLKDLLLASNFCVNTKLKISACGNVESEHSLFDDLHISVQLLKHVHVAKIEKSILLCGLFSVGKVSFNYDIIGSLEKAHVYVNGKFNWCKEHFRSRTISYINGVESFFNFNQTFNILLDAKSIQSYQEGYITFEIWKEFQNKVNRNSIPNSDFSLYQNQLLGIVKVPLNAISMPLDGDNLNNDSLKHCASGYDIVKGYLPIMKTYSSTEVGEIEVKLTVGSIGTKFDLFQQKGTKPQFTSHEIYLPDHNLKSINENLKNKLNQLDILRVNLLKKLQDPIEVIKDTTESVELGNDQKINETIFSLNTDENYLNESQDCVNILPCTIPAFEQNMESKDPLCVKYVNELDTFEKYTENCDTLFSPQINETIIEDFNSLEILNNIEKSDKSVEIPSDVCIINFEESEKDQKNGVKKLNEIDYSLEQPFDCLYEITGIFDTANSEKDEDTVNVTLLNSCEIGSTKKVMEEPSNTNKPNEQKTEYLEELTKTSMDDSDLESLTVTSICSTSLDINDSTPERIIEKINKVLSKKCNNSDQDQL